MERLDEVKSLKERWDELKIKAKQEKRRLFARDAAKKLEVSEADLIATNIGHGSILLKADWHEVVHAIKGLGRAKYITRNDAAVLENVDQIESIGEQGHGGWISLYCSQNVIRCHVSEWKYAFAVTQEMRPGVVSSSIQIYDKYGEASFKAFILDAGKQFAQAVSALAALKQTAILDVEKKSEKIIDSKHNVDKEVLEQGWNEIKDVHEFPSLLKKHGLTKLQACALVKEEFAKHVPASALPELLRMVASHKLKIITLVENHGAIQIYTGGFKKYRMMETWANILDPDVNIHVQMEIVLEGYIVHRPQMLDNELRWEKTLCFFDRHGQECINFFPDVKNHPDSIEAWEEILLQIAKQAVPA